MSKLIALIKALIPTPKSQRDLDEAYLCESVSVYDLERRMKNMGQLPRDKARSFIFDTMMP